MWITTSGSPLYPLYRFYAETGLTNAPHLLFTNFLAQINLGSSVWTNMSHLVDGVVQLIVRPYDLNGIAITNGYTPFMSPPWGAFVYGPVPGAR